MTPLERVKEFHKAFAASDDPVLWSKLIHEEWRELQLATSHENAFKEICDLVYVLMGYCIVRGWDFDEAFFRVHLSNMSKLGQDGVPIRREDGKIVKGPNYKPADLGDLI